MTTPFSLRIFVADGDPDGLRLVERSNWVGKALIFPRALLPQVKQRPELAETGVYLLLGPREDGEGDKLYIGEGDPIRPRLDNGNHPAEPTLHEADRADMMVFLDNMLGMLPVLGVHAFEQAPVREKGMGITTQLTCRGKGVVATGYEASQGFVVKAGSQADADTVPSMQQHVRGFYDMRQELIANGVLVLAGSDGNPNYRFAQDYVFSAPSSAAAVVLGRSANGRIEWKDAQGHTLKELQEREAGA